MGGTRREPPHLFLQRPSLADRDHAIMVTVHVASLSKFLITDGRRDSSLLRLPELGVDVVRVATGGRIGKTNDALRQDITGSPSAEDQTLDAPFGSSPP